MEFWDNILHTALLGTDKRVLSKSDFSEDFAETIDLIYQSSTDKEIQFLNTAAVAFSYRKCGVKPLHTTIVQSLAEAEEKNYCSPAAHQLLRAILSAESQSLLQLWLEQCNKNNEIVQPEWVPVLLSVATKYKELQALLLETTGKRGEWLVQLNDAWKPEPKIADEDLWQTGTVEQRRNYLQKQQIFNPAKARELLQAVWAAENANTKAELLKALSENISDEDVPWLEQLLNEKSQKVKDEALRLLKLCPTSSTVQQYWAIVRESIRVKKDKGLLGIGSKTSLEIALAGNIDDAIYKSGIQKIASQKNVQDDDFVLYQLVSAVPPHFFEQYYELDKKTLLELFIKTKPGKKLIPAFGLAAVIFKEVDWLQAVIAINDNHFYPEAFKLLPEAEREPYILSFFSDEQSAENVLHSFEQCNTKPWSLHLTKVIFTHTAKHFYQYNQAFYKRNILFIPTEIIPELEKFSPAAEYAKTTWQKTSEYITNLLTLKTKTLQFFQS